jgi:hypothetical protein
MTEYQIVDTAVVVACTAAKLLTSDKALDEYCEAPAAAHRTPANCRSCTLAQLAAMMADRTEDVRLRGDQIATARAGSSNAVRSGEAPAPRDYDPMLSRDRALDRPHRAAR